MTINRVVCEHCKNVWRTGQKSEIVICPKCMKKTKNNIDGKDD